jgi:hypothetical protein
MDAEPMYLNAHADEEREQRRLRNLEAWHNRATIRHLGAIGLGESWRCLEVGAGAGFPSHAGSPHRSAQPARSWRSTSTRST